VKYPFSPSIANATAIAVNAASISTIMTNRAINKFLSHLPSTI